MYVYTMCNGFYAYDACTNQQRRQQRQYRRLADEDDELSEVQPGIFCAILSCAVIKIIIPLWEKVVIFFLVWLGVRLL